MTDDLFDEGRQTGAQSPPAGRARAFDAAPPPARALFNQSPQQNLDAELEHLKQWAAANLKDARKDALAFWAFKIPAILASASAGIWAHFELTTVSMIAGAIASVCVIVDGIHPRGMLRNTHLKAYHDIRMLMSSMASRVRSTAGTPEKTVREIIRESEPKRKRIETYIRDAETALKSSHKG
jgi:hypothetical protein